MENDGGHDSFAPVSDDQFEPVFNGYVGDLDPEEDEEEDEIDVLDGETSDSDDDVDDAAVNHAHLCRLLVEGGTAALRALFNSAFPPNVLSERLAQPDTLKLLRRMRQQNALSAKQWETLYPSNKRGGTSRKYDIQLLMVLLQNVCHMSAPYPHGWEERPLEDDTSISAEIARVTQYRKQLSVSAAVPLQEYEILREEMQATLLRLVSGGGVARPRLVHMTRDEMVPEDVRAKWVRKLKVRCTPSPRCLLFCVLCEVQAWRLSDARLVHFFSRRYEQSGKHTGTCQSLQAWDAAAGETTASSARRTGSLRGARTRPLLVATPGLGASEPGPTSAPPGDPGAAAELEEQHTTTTQSESRLPTRGRTTDGDASTRHQHAGK